VVSKNFRRGWNSFDNVLGLGDGMHGVLPCVYSSVDVGMVVGHGEVGT
jgi:hypothetical protein